mgnify:CR=1 FL=1
MKVLYLEDQAMIREATTNYLKILFPDWTITAVGTGEAAIALIRLATEHFDLFLADLSISGKSEFPAKTKIQGTQVIEFIQSVHPECKVVVLTAMTGDASINHLININVNAILFKSSDLSELNQAIEEVKAGNTYYAKDIEPIIKKNSINNKLSDTSLEITKLQHNIVQLLKLGKGYEEVAAELHTELRTVRYQIELMRRATLTKNIPELITYMTENQIIVVNN